MKKPGMVGRRFADVYWQVCDIKNRRPNYSDWHCRDVLTELEEQISEAMSEAGWSVIDDYLDETDPEEVEE